MAAARAHGLVAIMAQNYSVVTIQCSELTRQLIVMTGFRENLPNVFQVLEFIGQQETSSGCSLMGVGEKNESG